MLIDSDLGPGKTRPVDDAGMVQPVGKDDVLFAGGSVSSDQWCDGRLVGAETTLHIKRVLHTLEGCKAFFQLYVQPLRAGN